MSHSLESINPANQTSRQMSNRYVVMDTRKVVNAILSETDANGNSIFKIRSIETKRGRKTQNLEGRGKHLIRIQTVKDYTLNGDTVYPEIILKNSYDGSSQLECYVGVFRLACSNGLIIPAKDGAVGSIKIRHNGTPEQAAFDIVLGFKEQLKTAIKIQKDMQQIAMTDEQMIDFAMAAAQLRWDVEFTAADAEKLLAAARKDDEGDNLWVVMNRIQEKLINGGIKLENSKRTSRKITNVQNNLDINLGIYELAYQYMN